MKLLVIVLCLISERYLIHAASHYRFYWFNVYFNFIANYLPQATSLTNSFLALVLAVLPILVITWLVLALFAHVIFGFIGLIITIIIFYYCLGPENPFYPLSTTETAVDSEAAAGNYFSQVNNQLFAVIFWFIVAGPLGALFYRLIYLCREQELTRPAAEMLVSWLDWITVRITLLLYLLVGNFQRGFHYYSQNILASPSENETLLSTGGLLAAHTQEENMITLPYAQNLVEHALVVFLVFIAFFTLAAWL